MDCIRYYADFNLTKKSNVKNGCFSRILNMGVDQSQ